MKESITISNCKNCGHSVENVNFCSHCGAKKITKGITLKSLITEISEVYLNVDSTLIRTIKDLTIKPHVVIEEYINGVRKKHLNLPSYFLLSLTLSTILSFIKEKAFHIASETEKYDGKSEMIQLFLETTEKYPTLGYFIFIPFYSLMSRFIFRKYRKYNFIEHSVINAYLIAHLTMLTFIPYIITFIFGDYLEESSFIFLLIQLIYATFLFKNLYNVSYWKIIVKGFVGFLLIFLIIVGISVIGGLAYKILEENGLINQASFISLN
ncbi:DUF3667 domain-containing protein [Aquimarina litoralis]|uniref:DUF3667 domain-containing protein n=1 Tax=Aquimarina litoralis TaxID=584605 RepID=UPI001C5751BA|nr:DUF3667 domain-containing protein [Aquimarina litoralis]MBW1298551.1 DUF3667 domain-containing protein [Aquimarina litoralis]